MSPQLRVPSAPQPLSAVPACGPSTSLGLLRLRESYIESRDLRRGHAESRPCLLQQGVDQVAGLQLLELVLRLHRVGFEDIPGAWFLPLIPDISVAPVVEAGDRGARGGLLGVPGRIEAQSALIGRPPEACRIVRLVAGSGRGVEASCRIEISTAVRPEPGLVRVELAQNRRARDRGLGR